MTPLTTKILERRRPDGTVPPALLKEVTSATLSYARERLHLSQNEAADLVSDFYPYILRAIRTYRQEETSFEAYLFTILRLERRARRRRDRREAQIRRMVRSGALGYRCTETDRHTEVCERPPRSSRGWLVSDRENDARRKRLICAVVRNAALLTAAQIDLYSSAIGVSPTWLDGIARCAREELAENFARIERWRNLRDRYFAVYLTCQIELRYAVTSAEREPIIARMEMNRSRLDNARRRIARVNTQLTHRRIGELLGIPKGSVDSCLAQFAHDLAPAGADALPFVHDTSVGQ